MGASENQNQKLSLDEKVGKTLKQAREWAKNNKTLTFLITVIAIVSFITISTILKLNWIGFGEDSNKVTTIEYELDVKRENIILEYIDPNTKKQDKRKVVKLIKKDTENFQQFKTLWDWLQLGGVLAIPIALYYFERSEQRRAEKRNALEQKLADEQNKLEKEEAAKNQREDALESYIYEISKLLIDTKLVTKIQEFINNIININKNKNKDIKNLINNVDPKLQEIEILFKNPGISIEEAVNKGYTREEMIKENPEIMEKFDKILSKYNPLEYKANESEIIEKIKMRKHRTYFEIIQQLKKDAEISVILDIIQARTLLILRKLGKDGERKGEVIRFLIDVEIIDKLDLSYANLNNASLEWAKLNNANLRMVELNNANLFRAELNNVYLAGAELNNANLEWAELNNANLEWAELNNANLEWAELNDATLFEANLNNANLADARNLTPERVKAAKDWQEAKYDKNFYIELVCGDD